MKKILITFLILLSQSAFANTESDSDRLFNWAENAYPELFSPSNQTSQISGDYYYRYYPETNNYLGTDTVNLDVYVLGDVFNGLLRIDTLDALLLTVSTSSGDGLGSLTVTGEHSDIFNEHNFSPSSFESNENGDMSWEGSGEYSQWAIILGILPNTSPAQVSSVTFFNGWNTYQIVDMDSLSHLPAPVAGVTIDGTSVTFNNVSNSPTLTLNGTLFFQ